MQKEIREQNIVKNAGKPKRIHKIVTILSVHIFII